MTPEPTDDLETWSESLRSLWNALKDSRAILREQQVIIRKRNGHIRALKRIIKDLKEDTNAIFSE